MKKVLILNGPNLNLLGRREPEIYGGQSFDKVLEELRNEFPNIRVEYYQSNHEGNIIDKIQSCDPYYDGIVLNAGGYTHTSVAIRDAISAISVPVIEMHISNIAAREEFRHTSMIAPVCKGSIIGLGVEGYKLALEFFNDENNTD